MLFRIIKHQLPKYEPQMNLKELIQTSIWDRKVNQKTLGREHQGRKEIFPSKEIKSNHLEKFMLISVNDKTIYKERELTGIT